MPGQKADKTACTVVADVTEPGGNILDQLISFIKSYFPSKIHAQQMLVCRFSLCRLGFRREKVFRINVKSAEESLHRVRSTQDPLHAVHVDTAWRVSCLCNNRSCLIEQAYWIFLRSEVSGVLN